VRAQIVPDLDTALERIEFYVACAG
jgi:hypothetical protein